MLEPLITRLKCEELAARLANFAQESIVRVRCGTQLWEGTNREWLATPHGHLRTSAFRTASVTKTFTSALTFRLMEQGKLSPSDTIDQHLPTEYLRSLPQSAAATSSGGGITLRQLLDHSSGLYDYATDADFRFAVMRTPSRRWSAKDLLEAAQSGRPYFPPGSGVAYSDTGYVLLGLIIQGVAEMPLSSAYRLLVAEPLGLTDTYLEGADSGSGLPIAHAFQGNIDTFDFDPTFDAFGGGGLISTASELDRFISSLMSGSFFCNSTTLDSMLRGKAMPDGIGTRKTYVACGISEFEVGGTRLWGHLGHWNSFMLYNPSLDLSLCGTFNQSTSSPAQIEFLECAVRTAREWTANK